MSCESVSSKRSGQMASNSDKIPAFLTQPLPGQPPLPPPRGDGREVRQTMPPPPEDRYAMHPEAKRYAAIFSDTMHANEQLQAQIKEILNENTLLRARISELEYEKDHERSEKEYYQRCTTAMQENALAINRATIRMVEMSEAAASKSAQNPKKIKPVSKQLSQVEQEIADVATRLNASEQESE